MQASPWTPALLMGPIGSARAAAFAAALPFAGSGGGKLPLPFAGWPLASGGAILPLDLPFPGSTAELLFAVQPAVPSSGCRSFFSSFFFARINSHSLVLSDFDLDLS